MEETMLTQYQVLMLEYEEWKGVDQAYAIACYEHAVKILNLIKELENVEPECND